MNLLPNNIKLQNADKGDYYYCVSLTPVGYRPLNIFTFANDRYQALETAWGILGFCDIGPSRSVSRVF